MIIMNNYDLKNNIQPMAIKISHVKKEYRLGQIGGGTLQRDLQSWWAKKRGLEDPNRKIGARPQHSGDRFLALDDINLTIAKGEAIGIIGRNGAGKSTLLKLLSRVTAPTEGVIELFGKVTSMLEVGTGFHGEMTGRENIYMNGAILGMSKAQIDSKLEDIIEFSEVGEFIDTPVKRYSSGMYVKLAFSVAVHLQSDIMIMDEVLAVGDMAFQNKCLAAMHKASTEEGRTILYVSHNMNTIRQLCDRCIVLDKGKIVFDGNTDEAIDVYMDTRRSVETEIDYRETEPPRWLLFPKIKLLEASYPDKSSNQFDRSVPMTLRLKWENLEDITDANMRFEVRSTDGIPHATFVLEHFYTGKKGEVITADFEIDISSFAEASYNTIYTFYQLDKHGGEAHLDCRSGLGFEVTSSDKVNKLLWEPRKWGYLILNDIKVNSFTSEECLND